MSLGLALGISGAVLVAAAVLAWEFWICEGAHLGRHFVVWLYDLSAQRYDGIKHFNPDWERRFLGEPLANALAGLEDARLLDVGAGTGRVARTLAPLGLFRGIVIGVEPSPRMLERGRQAVAPKKTRWVRAWAVPLPFPAEAFDMVTSLEVAEFTPEPLASLAEMVRVLRQGGWLLVTNRVGWQARWIAGRTFPRGQIGRRLQTLGLEEVQETFWQRDYDLVWARKRFRDDTAIGEPACA